MSTRELEAFDDLLVHFQRELEKFPQLTSIKDFKNLTRGGKTKQSLSIETYLSHLRFDEPSLAIVADVSTLTYNLPCQNASEL